MALLGKIVKLFQETFSVYLFGAVGLLVPAIILTVYILLMQNHSIEESYKELAAMLFMLMGFEMNYITLVNGCHKGEIS